MTAYYTKDGDVLDDICHRFYGRTSDVVEIIIEANPILLNHELSLPSGLIIQLPDIPTPQTNQEQIRLFS